MAKYKRIIKRSLAKHEILYLNNMLTIFRYDLLSFNNTALDSNIEPFVNILNG